ncbi:MAG: response regulator transcription factor [Bacteroidota bacterium]
MHILKIIIADDHPIFLEGLKLVLQRHPHFEVQIVAEAQDGQQLLDLLRKTSCDLLVMDLNMPIRDGFDVLENLSYAHQSMKTIVLTMYDDPKIVKAAFKAGVNGYLLKGNDIQEMYMAIEEVMSNQTFMGENVGMGQIHSVSDLNPSASTLYVDRFTKKYNLTRRELEVLRLISDAMSNKEIAKELYISDQTVSVHRKNIMRKLGVSNTAGLVKIAYHNSLI